MKNLSEIAMCLCIGIASVPPAFAQDSFTQGARTVVAEDAALRATLKRYTVPFFLSKSSSTNPRAVTIITAATPAGGGCSVRIDFFFGGDAVLACSLTEHVGKNRAFNFCTRSTTKSYVSCAFTCSPELDFHQGKAVISTADTTACAKTAFEARLYYFNGTTGDDSVAGLSNSAVVPLN